jgi:hypothetical protein
MVTGDWTWMFQYDPETKRQSQKWSPKSSRLKKTECQKTKGENYVDLQFYPLRIFSPKTNTEPSKPPSSAWAFILVN